MSLFKFTDPDKRDQLVKEYIYLKKKVQQDNIAEKVGDYNLQMDLSKLYRPLIDSQSGINNTISNLKDQLALTFSNPEKDLAILRMGPSELLPPDGMVKTLTDSKVQEKPNILNFGKIATNYLRLYTKSKKSTDPIFGIHSNGDELYIGKKPITINNDDITVDGKKYDGTPGLWELVTKFKPNKEVYSNEGLRNYREILINTDALTTDKGKVRSSRSEKYNELISPIWKDIRTPILSKRKLEYGTGVKRTRIQTVILPSDPNALVEMLELRIAAWEAGNSSSRNEAVAISDELLRQGVLSKGKYEAIQNNLAI
ncbi:uncharacterized protein LOC136086298 [Hydra vulgaris]|uniref:Uncharacterized protein LOC136086298 n=1 Tax=Hydra vulgaris TaxID=6087 RepID=A0ABM4CS00_HYDVU